MLLLGALPIHGVLQTAWHAVFLSTGQLVSARIDPLGAPTTSLQVKIITPHLSCGPEVTIDIEASSSKDEIKQKLVEATGVPFEHQKVMLSGINQIVMGDKRCEELAGGGGGNTLRGLHIVCSLQGDSASHKIFNGRLQSLINNGLPPKPFSDA